MSRHRLDPADLLGALRQAQSDLERSPPGSRHTWELPAGEFTLPFGLRFGAEGRSLVWSGAETTLVFYAGDGAEALALRGEQLVLEGLTLSAARDGDLQALCLDASRQVSARSLCLRDLRGNGVRGLLARAPTVELHDIEVDGLAATASGSAVEVQANASARLKSVRLHELRGHELLGIGLLADQTTAEDVLIRGLGATETATGLRAGATTRLDLRDVELDGLRGRAVLGITVDAPDGEVHNLSSDRLEALDTAQPLQLAPGAHVSVTGLALVRRFQPEGLEAQLELAVADLADAVAGSDHTWLLPPGIYDFDGGWDLGTEDVSLHIRGPQGGGAPAHWRFGRNAAVAGDLIALRLVGRSLTLDGLVLEARCSGALKAVQLTGSLEAAADDLRLQELRAEAVTGIEIEAPRVGLTDVAVTEARATAGDGIGISVRAGEMMLRHLAVNGLNAREAALGIDGQALRQCSASSLCTEGISGSRALGIRLRLSAAEARLMLLDLSARRITADAQDGDALGILAMATGAVELRGASASRLVGGRATGVFLGVGRELEWLAGRIEDVRGRKAGAAGVRVLAGESDEPLSISDLHIEAIRGSPTGDSPQPDPQWGRWWRGALIADRLPETLAAGETFARQDVTGLQVDAYVPQTIRWTDTDPGVLSIRDCVLRRISGTALQVDGGVRDLELRGTEAWTSLRGGWLDGERLILAQLTWHRHHRGLTLGPAAVTIANCLVTGIGEGTGIQSDADTDFDRVLATYVGGAIELFDPAPDPLPYLEPGPQQIPPSVLAGSLAPKARVDLRLGPGHGLKAQRLPGDDTGTPLFIGAHEPDLPAACELRDPRPPTVPEQPIARRPSPVVDYRSRDARSLLAVMMDRARISIPQWQNPNAADQLTMLMELLAHELDQLSYRQEVAMSEGSFAAALSRRSVEDHARLVDYEPDPGLSASTMVRFDIDEAGSLALGLGPAEGFEIPADTLVVNPDATEISLIFATEDSLRYDPLLRDLRLLEPLAPGAVSARLGGDLIEQGQGVHEDRARIEPGRWLVLVPPEADGLRHVVRVTRVELGADATQVFWDPRRPSPAQFPVEGTQVYGNVVPAHHGVPLAPLSEHLLPSALQEAVESMRPWREQMRLRVDNSDGTPREVELPLDPVSVQASGWPLPGETRRQGLPRLEVWVNGERWTRVDQLALCSGDDECYVLRPGRGGGAAIRFGDGTNAMALPPGQVTIELRMRIGRGRQGNVGIGALTRLLGFGRGGDIARLLPQVADRDQIIRDRISVSNLVAGTGGRDPEPIEQIRYQAPRQVRESLSAVALSDFARLLEQIPEVAAARAVLVDAGIRRLVRVTVLLTDEDTLAQAELGSQREAERLRRWAVVRHRLESIRLLGLDVELLPPLFVPLDLDILVDAEPWASAELVRSAVQEALGGDGGLFDPDRRGLGRDVQVDRLHQSVLAVEGVAAARVRRLRRLQRDTEEYAELGRLPVGPDEVAVLRHPYGAKPDGLVTVEVCGGIA